MSKGNVGSKQKKQKPKLKLNENRVTANTHEL